MVGKCHVAECTDPKCLMLHICNGTLCRHKCEKAWLPHDQFERTAHKRRKCCIQSQVLTKPICDAKKKEAPDRDGCAQMLDVVYRQFLEEGRRLEEASGINLPDEGMSPPPVCVEHTLLYLAGILSKPGERDVQRGSEAWCDLLSRLWCLVRIRLRTST